MPKPKKDPVGSPEGEAIVSYDETTKVATLERPRVTFETRRGGSITLDPPAGVAAESKEDTADAG